MRPNSGQLEIIPLNQLIEIYQTITKVGKLYIHSFSYTQSAEIQNFSHVLQASNGWEPETRTPWTAFITQSGKLYVVYPANGQVAQINIGDNIAIQVSCGYGHLAFINDKGEVRIWGNNQYGQLGLGDTEPRDYPTLIPELIDVVQISCGYTHTALITGTGDLYIWGQLKLGNSYNLLVPTVVSQVIDHRHKIIAIPKIKQVSCGNCGTAILSNSGQLYVVDNHRPNNLLTQIPFPGKMISVDCQGTNLSFALSEDGSVYSCVYGKLEIEKGQWDAIFVSGSYTISKHGNLFFRSRWETPKKIPCKSKVIYVTSSPSHTAYIALPY